MYCPNCCTELEDRKIKHNKGNYTVSKKKKKCPSCGYEVSNWELEQEILEFRERIKQKNKHYTENVNNDPNNPETDYFEYLSSIKSDDL